MRALPISLTLLAWLVSGCTAETRATLRDAGSGGSASSGGENASGSGNASDNAGGSGSGGASGSGNASGGEKVSGTGGGSGIGGGSGTGSGNGTGGAGGPVDGGGVDGGGASGTARAIAAPPTYRGTVNDAGGCAHDYVTHGFEPDDTGTRHPLFLYFTGTNFVSDEASFRDQSAPAANAVTEAMAKRGFVALWVEYDNGAVAWLSDHVAQLECLFGKDPTTALAVGCALPNVDCDLGIATWGHSQGAYVANRAHDFDGRVRATWTAGYGGDAQATMPKDRFRVENGENDTTNGQVATVNQVAGFTAAECPDDGRNHCFRPDGSGWVIVRAADCVTSTADHCWFDKKTCLDTQPTLEPNWIDPASQKPFALASNADWVAATVARP